MKFEVTPDLLTGDAMVDAQHREVIAAFNNIMSACENNKGKEEVEGTLRFLSEFTIRHFAEEEELLARVGYPGFQEHAGQHNRFREKITALERQYEREGATPQILADVITGLADWLIEHIRAEDRKMAEYIRKSNVWQPGGEDPGTPGYDKIPGKRVMDNALEMILLVDSRGIISYGNRAAGEELGYRDELCGLKLATVLRPDSGAGTDFLPEELREGETVFYRKNNTCFAVRVRLVKQPPDRCFLFAVSLEIQKEMEHRIRMIKQEAGEAMQVKSEFVANVTHELRTPLNGIVGHLENLSGTPLNAGQRETLEIVKRCCGNMESIISHILDFSKIEAGKLELEQKEFSFYKMMDYVAAANIVGVNEKGLRLTVNIDRAIPEYLIGDELRISQILNNLVSNAVKFTSVGYVRVEVTKTLQFDDEIELFFLVSDTGIGISKEEQKKLFRSFSQVDASITRQYGGTGLGLAISRELIHMMGGSINLESEKGLGSNFSFSLRLQMAGRERVAPELKEAFAFLNRTKAAYELDRKEEPYRFGSPENGRELRDKMEKLILCVELGAWAKAEIWAGEIKKLTGGAETELKRAVLRLEMAVRREDYDKSVAQYGEVKERLAGLLEE